MKLIDKDAVVAEIERLRRIQPTDEFQPKEQNKIDWLAGKEFAITTLQVSLDTFEVKEVEGIDLEKEVDTWRHNHFHGRRDKNAAGEYLEMGSQLELAKHFFEHGMAVSNKAQKGEDV